MSLIPIQSVTVPMIRTAIADAMAVRDLDRITDFLASVDWSHFGTADPAIRDLLGRVELWDTEFVEKDITEAEYTERLRSVLAAKVAV